MKFSHFLRADAQVAPDLASLLPVNPNSLEKLAIAARREVNICSGSQEHLRPGVEVPSVDVVGKRLAVGYVQEAVAETEGLGYL